MTTQRLSLTFSLAITVLLVISAAADAQQLQWGAANGPHGAVCEDLVITPAGTLLVNDEVNGIWRSTDNGGHWYRSVTGFITTHVEALALAADGAVLAGEYNALYRSTDDGITWSNISTGLSGRSDLTDILVLSDGTVFCNAWSGGIFTSTDHGLSWTETTNGLPAAGKYYELRGNNNDDIFACGFNSALYRSTDRGATWETLPLAGYIYDLGCAPDGTLWAVKSDAGIFRSADNGDSWTKSDQGIPYFRGHGFLFRGSGEILLGVNHANSIYRSTDDGATWSPFDTGMNNAWVQGFHHRENGDSYVMTYGTGVHMLPKDSSRWQPLNEGMQGSRLYAVETVPGGPVFAGGYGCLWVSHDAGESWKHADEDIHGFQVADILFAHQRLFVSATSNGVYRSTDLGIHWEETNNGLTTRRITRFAAADNGMLFCGSEGAGVYATTDNGDTWYEVSNGLANPRVWDVCVDVNAALYAGTDEGVFKSTNFGEDWVSASTGLLAGRIFSLLATHGCILAGTGSRVYRSSDGGSNWVRVGENQLPSRVIHEMRQAVDGVIYAATDVGVYSSTDGGSNWASAMKQNLLGQTNDIAIADDGNLYAATYMHGIFRSPPLSANPEVTIRTEPAGRFFTVDGTEYTSSHTFEWPPSSTHTISTTHTQTGVAGTRYIWKDWSDGGDLSHTITVGTSAQVITSSFSTEYQLQMLPDGAGNVTPQTGWYNPGATVTIRATPQIGQSFSRWEGMGPGSYSGTDNPATVTMSGPITETAHFSGGGIPREITITTNPPGRRITVDGEAFSSQRTFTWDVGSRHEIETTSPQTGAAGRRYVWNSWSSGEAMKYTWTVSAGPAMTLTASFDTEYQLTMTAGIGGTVTPQTGWHLGGTQPQLLATPNAGYAFDRWEGTGNGSYSGTVNPVTVTIQNAVSEFAVFRQVTDVRPNTRIPSTVELYQNAPNPSRGETVVSFSLPMAQPVSLVVTDILGREIARPIDGVVLAHGFHTRALHLTGFPSGIYLCRLETADGVQVRALTLQK